MTQQEPHQGTYQLRGQADGRLSWENSASAIWYYPESKDWHIGILGNKGTESGGLISLVDEDQNIFEGREPKNSFAKQSLM